MTKGSVRATEGRGGEKGGSANFKTKDTEHLAYKIIPLGSQKTSNWFYVDEMCSNVVVLNENLLEDFVDN